MEFISIVNGVSLGPGHCVALAQIRESPESDPTSLIMNWSSESGITGWGVDCILHWMACTSGPEPQIFFCGPLGYVVVLNKNNLSNETIHFSLMGPDDLGFLRDLRVIDQSLFATGMSRQVYRRLGPDNWGRCDKGTACPPQKLLDVPGFNSIDGATQKDLYAVGFGGEIWRRRQEQWKQIDSPTNAALYCVKAVNDKSVYACGQAGVFLSGYGDTWKFIDHDATRDVLWSMEWFQGHLYLATMKQLYRYENNELLEIDLGLPGPRSFARLHSDGQALWSFGSHHLSWTENGHTWEDAVIE